MDQREKDRLIEVLFYLYFNNIEPEKLKTAVFWDMIKSICIFNKINPLTVSNAVRIMANPDNVPTDEETYYLLNKVGLTVRPLRKISGIYWQKQKEFAANPMSISVYPRINDTIYKIAMRDFINAIYETSGICMYVDKRLLREVL